MSEKEIVLSSGKRVKIRMPPLSVDFLLKMQQQILKVALIDAKKVKLTYLEAGELSETICGLNLQYWNKVRENPSLAYLT